jgi:nicotinamidase-related amidase
VQLSNYATLVIDMQNGFCAEDGSFAQMIRGTEMSIALNRSAIPNCARLIQATREVAAPVIYTRYVYQRDYSDRDILIRKYPGITELNALAKDSWDADIIPELSPADSDFVIDKSRYSAFKSTRLEALLHGLQVSTLVVCGVTTNICVESTAREAAEKDFDVVIASDATGEFTEQRHRNALDILEYGFATVASSDEIVRAIVAAGNA